MAPPQLADEVVLPALQTQATVLLMIWPRLALLALLFSAVARILHDHHLQETLNPTHPPILSVCIDETFFFIKGQQSARHHNLPSSIESITHVLQNG
jgi:hypothetical protein